MDITERLKEIIKQETNTDIEIRTRKRETIEMRSLYCTVLKQLKPKKTLQAIGDTIELNHATVINSLNNYKVYEQYNPELKKFKTTILSYFTMDDSELKELLEIEKLKHKVMELKIENDSLRIQLHKLNEINSIDFLDMKNAKMLYINKDNQFNQWLSGNRYIGVSPKKELLSINYK